MCVSQIDCNNICSNIILLIVLSKYDLLFVFTNSFGLTLLQLLQTVSAKPLKRETKREIDVKGRKESCAKTGVLPAEIHKVKY